MPFDLPNQFTIASSSILNASRSRNRPRISLDTIKASDLIPLFVMHKCWPFAMTTCLQTPAINTGQLPSDDTRRKLYLCLSYRLAFCGHDSTLNWDLSGTYTFLTWINTNISLCFKEFI
jgi:hypothetical protein